MSLKGINSTAHVIAGSFLFMIFTGSLLLKLPFATEGGISYIDALFTSTSAVCVTGLIVVDTATAFTGFGKGVILLLIQLGGLGIMTFAALVIWLVRQKISLSDRLMLEYSFLQGGMRFPLRSFLAFILKYTFIVEFAGFLGYFFTLDEADIWKRAGFSLFHAISAFCNAGFSLYSENLAGYYGNPGVNMVTMILVVLGGIGFVVIFELKNKYRILLRMEKRRFTAPIFSLHTWTVLVTSSFLIAAGGVLIFLFQLSSGYRISFLSSLFHSVCARTAGFNTVDLGALSTSSLLVIIFLMFIGGSPGSTAGGIKTTTFALFLFIMFMGRNNFEDVTARNRSIPRSTIFQGLLVLMFSFTVVFTSLIMLSVFQPGAALGDLLFETVSAFGTVGLSTGITGNLTFMSKCVITVTMFIGRLGSLTIFSLFLNRKSLNIKHAEERILIG